MNIERAEKRAVEKQLASRRSSKREVSLHNERRAELLVRRIDELNRRIARVQMDQARFRLNAPCLDENLDWWAITKA